MKKFILLLSLIVALGVTAVVTPGCAWFQPSTVAVGSDPVVVGAEQASKLGLAFTSEFLQWEWLNRATVGKDITRLADKVRDEFPKDHAALRAATKAYKLNRSPENKATLETVTLTLNAILEQVRLRLPAPEAAAALAKAKTLTP